MGQTVLTNLRKLSHPMVIERIKECAERKWYTHYRNHYMARNADDGIVISMQFKYHSWVYDFVVRKNSFSFYLTNKITKWYTKTCNAKSSLLTVASMEDIMYDELESAIFQGSLISDLGMFGVQEAEALIKIRDRYFGV